MTMKPRGATEGGGSRISHEEKRVGGEHL